MVFFSSKNGQFVNISSKLSKHPSQYSRGPNRRFDITWRVFRGHLKDIRVNFSWKTRLDELSREFLFLKRTCKFFALFYVILILTIRVANYFTLKVVAKTKIRILRVVSWFWMNIISNMEDNRWQFGQHRAHRGPNRGQWRTLYDAW